MLILSNGLTDVVDEGFLKVANSLVKRIKAKDPDVTVVSYERRSGISDCYLELNKLLLSRDLVSLIRKHADTVLYIPFPAKTFATALRIFILSLFAGVRPNVMLVMKSHYGFMARMLMRLSRANIIVLSKDAEDYYRGFLPSARVKYLKCGVDTEKFKPADSEEVSLLKAKYGLDPHSPVILHVGHLKSGRNVGELLKIHDEYQVVLVTSTLTKDEQDAELRESLLDAPNITVIDEYIPNIEEIYQMSDVYFFPTVADCNCIDIPLSCMEAASCGKPVVTTDYGEMKEFRGVPGFCFIDDFAEDNINALIEGALNIKGCDTRSAVLEYDWNNAISELMKR